MSRAHALRKCFLFAFCSTTLGLLGVSAQERHHLRTPGDHAAPGHILATDGAKWPQRAFDTAQAAQRWGRPRHSCLALSARFHLRARDPTGACVRDSMLPEKEAQLGRMLLDVSHSVEH